MVFQDNELNRISRLFNQIIVETYGLERESLDALSFIPAQVGVGPWLRSWSYKIVNEMGVAKLISDYRGFPARFPRNRTQDQRNPRIRPFLWLQRI